MDLLLLGAGGHAKDIIANIEDMHVRLPKASRINLIGCLDDTGTVNPDIQRLGYELFTDIKALAKPALKKAKLLCAVGDPLSKKLFIEKASVYKPVYANVIHPSAIVSRSAVLGTGVSIFAFSVVSGFSRIGNHASVNFHCSISHDSSIGEYATLGPGVNISGRVTIGAGVFVGVGGCCLNNVEIGPWCVVGAGSTVTKSVPACSIAAGTPHRIIRKRDMEKPAL